MERKPIPKKMRFEVFKRDKFTCQYCGRKAPDVVLEVDHIMPVAEGGKNEIINLVTSCRDCNRGKGKTALTDDSAVQVQRKALEDLEERREQMRMIIEWKKELVSLTDEMIDALDNQIITMTGTGFNELGETDIRRLLTEFTFAEVSEAITISFTKYFNGSEYSWDKAFNKIGGICYNRRNGRTADYYAEQNH